MKINVGVLFGGNSTEHEISIISAVQAMNNMDKDKYEIIPIYMSKDHHLYSSEALFDMDTYKNLKVLVKKVPEVSIILKDNDYILKANKLFGGVVSKLDLIFPIMHGYNTEDGSIAGYLESLGIAYCESDIYACSLGQDKVYQKMVLASGGINVVDYYYFYEKEFDNDAKAVIKEIEKLKYPVIVKPARQGSSVGISIAHNKDELNESIKEALSYDDKILVEKVVENIIELNCATLGTNGTYEASNIEEVYASKDLLSYEDKYLGNGSKGGKVKGMASAGRKVPADIPKDLEKKVKDMAIKASVILNTSGVVRTDFLVNAKTKEVYLNEMNITPGSLSFYLWDMPYAKLLDKIIECGIKKYQIKSKKTTSFETNVLEGFNGSKGVKGIKK